MRKNLLAIFLFVSASLGAQDTLPNFSVRDVGQNRIIIGWTNPYESIKQLSIQRSYDSTKGFTSILTVPDPTTPQNGYVDTRAPHGRMYYRLYIMLEGGFFMFSPAKKPILDTVLKATIQIPGVSKPNGDSTVLVGHNRPPVGYTPSLYVFTHRDGNVRVSLPGNEKPEKYRIRFLTESGDLLFELKDVKEKSFKVDKSAFYRAGWYFFELYEDDRLFERHKFFLARDY